MKKVIALAAALVLTIGLAGCGGAADDISIENSSSELYTEEDMDMFLERLMIMTESLNWEAQRVSYMGDELCNDEKLMAKMNELNYRTEEKGMYTECVGFSFDFRVTYDDDFWTGVKAFFSGQLNKEVHDYQWWFAKTEDGEWENAYYGETDIREELA